MGQLMESLFQDQNRNTSKTRHTIMQGITLVNWALHMHEMEMRPPPATRETALPTKTKHSGT